ncbi:MAG: HNH endonuclease family protein [Bifidobacterium sp.]|uniref:HNH endonuclease family protein n=2 Tax=Bifidobacterium TaxID=1678 RepID=A0AB39UMZ7_9BIFI
MSRISRRRRSHRRASSLDRLLSLLVIAVMAGVTVGLALPKFSDRINDLTGGYHAAGTAAAAVQALKVSDALPGTGHYDRKSFGFRETDTDGDGCDIRDDVLSRDLSSVRYRYAGSCIVESGILKDPYTTETIHFARGPSTSAKVQIDHVVALENAWQSGANTWSKAEKYRFGNDPYNLLAVDGSANQEKGSASAAHWLPSNRSYQCSYVSRQIGVKTKYHLTVTDAERRAMLAVLHTCPDRSLPSD